MVKSWKTFLIRFIRFDRRLIDFLSGGDGIDGKWRGWRTDTFSDISVTNDGENIPKVDFFCQDHVQTTTPATPSGPGGDGGCGGLGGLPGKMTVIGFKSAANIAFIGNRGNEHFWERVFPLTEKNGSLLFRYRCIFCI